MFLDVSESERLKSYDKSEVELDRSEAKILLDAALKNVGWVMERIYESRSTKIPIEPQILNKKLLSDRAKNLVYYGIQQGGNAAEFALIAQFDLRTNLARMSLIQAFINRRFDAEDEDIELAYRHFIGIWKLMLNFVTEQIETVKRRELGINEIAILKVLRDMGADVEVNKLMEKIAELKIPTGAYYKLKNKGCVDTRQVDKNVWRVEILEKGMSYLKDAENKKVEL
jgi:hypothetical protein